MDWYCTDSTAQYIYTPRHPLDEKHGAEKNRHALIQISSDLYNGRARPVHVCLYILKGDVYNKPPPSPITGLVKREGRLQQNLRLSPG